MDESKLPDTLRTGNDLRMDGGRDGWWMDDG